MKVEIDFTLPEFSATKIVTWGCHVDNSVKGRYNIILGICLLTKLVLSPTFMNTSSKEVMELLKGPQHP